MLHLMIGKYNIYNIYNINLLKMENQYEYEKYVCTKETLGHMITEYCVAIIPNVLNANECDNMGLFRIHNKRMGNAIKHT